MTNSPVSRETGLTARDESPSQTAAAAAMTLPRLGATVETSHRSTPQVLDNSTPAPQGDDKTLLTDIAARDVGALAAVYDRYAPTLVGGLLACGTDPRRTEAVVAEVFGRLWRIAPFLDPRTARLQDWLVLSCRSLGATRRWT